MAPTNPALAKRTTAENPAPTPPAAPAAQTTGAQPDPQVSAQAQVKETVVNKGYVVVRRPVGDQPSYLVASGGTIGWSWEIDKATKFKTKGMAEALIIEKKRDEKTGETKAGGPASGAGAKVEKVDERYDEDELDTDELDGA